MDSSRDAERVTEFCITLLLEQVSLILMGNYVLELTKLHESVAVEQTYPKDHCVSKITTAAHVDRLTCSILLVVSKLRLTVAVGLFALFLLKVLGPKPSVVHSSLPQKHSLETCKVG